MDLTRRQFGFGLAGFLLGGSSLADESVPRIIKPSLEEIAILMKKDPDEILKPAIEKGEIKKFEYTRRTKPENFYKFLREQFTEQTLFLYLEIDKDTNKKNKWGKESTGDFRLGSGAAIVFSFVNKNLRGTNNMGFLYLELKDFYDEENWVRVRRLFNTSKMEFPAYADFKRDSQGNYELMGIAGCGMKTPKFIQNAVGLHVDYYLNEKSN